MDILWATVFTVLLVQVRGQDPLALVESAHCYNETAIIFEMKDTYMYFIVDCQPGYCESDTGTCVENKPILGFECPADNGYYPNIEDCNGFVICADHEPNFFTCRDGLTYNPKTRKCVVGGECRRFNCSGIHGKYVVHDSDSSLYALCVKERPVSMNQCDIGKTFDVQKQLCAFICHGEGVMMDPRDHRRYYTCSGDQIGSEGTSNLCPPGTNYCPSKKECTDKYL